MARLGTSRKDQIVGQIYAGRFEVLGFLDSGVMGTVYRARNLKKDQIVALKLINKELIEEEEIVARFLREMRVTASIRHVNTAKVHQYGHTGDGDIYLAMELLEGDSLYDLISAPEPMPIDDVVLIAAQIARALEAARLKGVVHRDLKPENIMVMPHPTVRLHVKVIDFGLAYIDDTGSGSPDLTGEGSRVGTPHYMSPEYVECYKADHRSDLYGLGILLFEMLTGRLPFEGRPYEVFGKHVRDPVPSIAELAPRPVPTWLITLTESLLEKDPAERPKTAADVVKQIAQHIDLPDESEFAGYQKEVRPAALIDRLVRAVIFGLVVFIVSLGTFLLFWAP